MMRLAYLLSLFSLGSAFLSPSRLQSIPPRALVDNNSGTALSSSAYEVDYTLGASKIESLQAGVEHKVLEHEFTALQTKFERTVADWETRYKNLEQLLAQERHLADHRVSSAVEYAEQNKAEYEKKIRETEKRYETIVRELREYNAITEKELRADLEKVTDERNEMWRMRMELENEVAALKQKLAAKSSKEDGVTDVEAKRVDSVLHAAPDMPELPQKETVTIQGLEAAEAEAAAVRARINQQYQEREAQRIWAMQQQQQQLAEAELSLRRKETQQVYAPQPAVREEPRYWQQDPREQRYSQNTPEPRIQPEEEQMGRYVVYVEDNRPILLSPKDVI
jgi:hypothetical protein